MTKWLVAITLILISARADALVFSAAAPPAQVQPSSNIAFGAVNHDCIAFSTTCIAFQ